MSAAADQPSALAIGIAGGGLIGLSIAWRLAQRGYRVTVFDQAEIAGEASWAGAGMLSVGGEFDSPSLSTTLAIESRGLYRSLVRELERAGRMPIDYQECGALDLAYNPVEWNDLCARAERQASLGIESKRLTREQVQTFWPRVRSTDLVAALFYPGDGIVNPRDLTDALKLACRELGGEILNHSRVGSIELSNDRATIRLDNEQRAFDAVVIAAGAWSGSIPIANAPALPRSEPIKGHLIGFQQPDQTCNTVIRRGHTYILQRSNGLLIAGSSVEHAGWDRSIDPSIAASLVADANSLLPHLSETTPSETWIGFRPCSDTLHLGAWHSKRLYLAYGHYRNGILLAPVTAQNIEREISANLGKP